jgi:hypothetical protein
MALDPWISFAFSGSDSTRHAAVPVPVGARLQSARARVSLLLPFAPMAGTEDDEARAILPYGGVPRFSAPALLALRALAAILCLLFTAQLARTIQIDGSPFRSALLTPWMVTTLIDFYLVMLPLLLLVLVRHRASPVTGALACLFLCCLGTSATWAYLFFVFGTLRAGDPITRLLNC